MSSSFKLSLLAIVCIYQVSDVFTASVETNETSTLVFATIIFRHGDRTPIKPYPTDPWGDSKYWPVGWGQLTKLGKIQQYELGTWLRERYRHSVLGNAYNESNIYIQSTDYDRTLMSAYVNLAALYPPSSTERFMSTILWQPIPVHTIPKHLDDTLAVEKPCATYKHLLNETNNHTNGLLFNENKELLDYVRTHSQINISGIWDVQDLYDTLFIEQLNSKPLPTWTQKVFPGEGKFHGKFQQLADQAFLEETRTPQLARLTYGRLLKEILERFQNKSKGTLEPNRSVHIYSGHDTTIAGVLNSLGMFKLHSPPYTATVLFELRRADHEYFVQIFYRNNTAYEPEPMDIPNCGQSCPLEKMFKLYAHILPVHDSETECQWPQQAKRMDRYVMSSSNRAQIETSLLVMSVCIALTIFKKFFCKIMLF